MAVMRWLRLFGILGICLGLYTVVPVSLGNDDEWLRGIGVVLLLGLLAFGLEYQIRQAIRDSERRIDGLITAIILVLIVFSFVFYALEVHRPKEIDGMETRMDSLYFTASTMLTIGYGDVHAVGQLGRTLVLVQMVFDVVFVAAAVGLLTARVRRATGSDI